jgi:hypothetical protein
MAAATPARIYIATPTYGRQAYTNYIESVIALQTSAAVREAGITFAQLRFIDSPLISRARNAYASLVLQDPSLSHLLFIDSDIGFRPEAVLRMLALNEPFTACMYPLRWPDPVRAHATARDLDDPLLAQEAGLNYVKSESLIRETVEGRLAIRLRDGFAETAWVGMGLTLIRRDVLEIMAERRPDLCRAPGAWYGASGVKERVLQGFESEVNEDDGLYRSEDLSFCARWTRDCGGRIWVCINESLSHVGPTVFQGSYDKRLRYDAMLAQRAAQSPTKT